MQEPRFVFEIVRVGSEALAKAELSAAFPHVRLAFSRPGLLTFKDPSRALDETFGAGLVFARVAGRSLGLSDGAVAVAARIPEGVSALHVFPRAPEPDAIGAAASIAACASLEAEVRALAGARLAASGALALGDRVIDVAVAGDEASFVGVHRHAPGRWTTPGGLVPVEDRPAAPSRAYRKLDEALAWSGLGMTAGEVALELGSAPGGMTLALLSRGVRVIAVDPAAMSAEVIAYVGPGGARAQHLQVAAGAVRVEALPDPLDWIVVDLNLAPPVALRYLSRVVRARPPRRGAIVTLKLNDAAMVAQIPEHLERVRGMGFGEVRATQLPANRMEIAVVALPRARAPG